MASSNNKTVKQNNTLNPRQKLFCQYYVENPNATEAAIKAGYKETTAFAQASRMLRKVGIQEEIERIRKPLDDKHIATAQEVMQFFTDMMNGKIKDAFGLDATNSDRLKAANELAKRTVDIDNRAEGKADARVEISLD
jgi:phage terminase small subunit